jgi:hypothetical protein
MRLHVSRSKRLFDLSRLLGEYFAVHAFVTNYHVPVMGLIPRMG